MKRTTSTSTRTTFTRLAAVVALTGALVACGGDDGGSGPGGGGAQAEVARLLIQEFEGEEMEGMSVDEACVRSATSQLSDADAAALVAAYPDGDPELSMSDAEEDAFFEELFTCVEFDFDLDD